MPFAKRIIVLENDGSQPVEVAGLKAVCSLLLTLIEHADDIWSELTAECGLVAQRTSRLRLKIEHVTAVTAKLNARAVHIRMYINFRFYCRLLF